MIWRIRRATHSRSRRAGAIKTPNASTSRQASACRAVKAIVQRTTVIAKSSPCAARLVSQALYANLLSLQGNGCVYEESRRRIKLRGHGGRLEFLQNDGLAGGSAQSESRHAGFEGRRFES